MAPKSGHFRPARYLALFGVIVVVLYALVFFTGDKSPKPKLGIDLQGGTSVTLTARTPDGSRPSGESLNLARQIIESRVNGLGVSGAEVLIDGDNIVITVPGDDSGQARALGQTAQLFIRPVLSSQAAAAPGVPVPGGVEVSPAPPAATEVGPEPANRPFPADTPTTPAPAPADATPAPTTPPTSTPQNTSGMTEEAVAAIATAKLTRQSTDPAVQAQTMATLDCSVPDPLQGNDDPALPLVACSKDGTTVYLLAPTIIDGQRIDDASAFYDAQSSQNTIQLKFKSDASETWAKFTSANLGKQAAFTLDTQVISAPVIQGATPAGSPTSITGQFSLPQAKELANQLKYGSLPLSFSQSDAKTVSATLGAESLKAGLIAGVVGLILVLLYCLIYYRALGVLIAMSLILSGVLIYPLLVLLGRSIGYSLNLAGIAGLIIGIGTTADSFVVYFERIKDEIREGRSFRSAVPRGWSRARRTILSGNTVSFIAAAVLYFLAVGDVKGFAFTLGLTTLLDLVVVFLVTHPLVHIVSTKAWASNPKVNGLGSMHEVARERQEAAQAALDAGKVS